MADAAKAGASQARRVVVAAGAIESSGGVVVESSSIVSGRANESDEAGAKRTLSPPAGRVRIFVTGLGGDATPIECDLPADTIATLKRQIQGVHDVEPARQRLVLNMNCRGTRIQSVFILSAVAVPVASCPEM